MWCTEAIEKARVQIQRFPGRPFHQNEPELTRLALKQMIELGLTVIPSDKDSGFVLIKFCDISALHEEILVEKSCNESTLHDINLLSMSKSLWKWAKIVSDHEGIHELKKELVLDHSRFGMDWVIAQLQTNLKTHKPPGQVRPRAIHSATKNPLVSLGEYVAWKLRKVLSCERHILNSVEESPFEN